MAAARGQAPPPPPSPPQSARGGMANLDFFALFFIPLTLIALLIFTGNRMRLYFLELRHRTAADSYDYKVGRGPRCAHTRALAARH